MFKQIYRGDIDKIKTIHYGPQGGRLIEQGNSTNYFKEVCKAYDLRKIISYLRFK